jgi:hypothetical protein
MQQLFFMGHKYIQALGGISLQSLHALNYFTYDEYKVEIAIIFPVCKAFQTEKRLLFLGGRLIFSLLIHYSSFQTILCTRTLCKLEIGGATFRHFDLVRLL